MILLSESATRKPRLLQAFYSFADANNKRLVQEKRRQPLFSAASQRLKDRVLGLEKRLNIPPS